MNEYLEVWDHISEKKKKGWRIAEIGKNIEKSFRTGDNVIRWALQDVITGETIIILYYTPVTTSLKKSGEKLGNYLHSLKQYHPENDPWWERFKKELQIIAKEVEKANIGTLRGPPMVKTEEGSFYINVDLLPNYNEKELLKKIYRKQWKVDIKNLKNLPTQIEPEAYIWK